MRIKNSKLSRKYKKEPNGAEEYNNQNEKYIRGNQQQDLRVQKNQSVIASR